MDNNLSLNQERYLFAEQFTPVNYHVPVRVVFKGQLDKVKFIASLEAVLDRHDIFKISIEKNSDGVYKQKINSRIKLLLDEHYLENENNLVIDQIIDDYCFQANDFLPDTLFKFQLIKVGQDQNIFVYSVHHILTDSVSKNIFLSELCEAWNDIDRYLEKPKSSYLEFIKQNKLDQINDSGSSAQYWQEHLKDFHPYQIKPDLVDVDNDTVKIDTKTIVIDPKLSKKLQNIAKQNGLTPFNLYYASLNILISKYTGQNIVCSSFQSSGRRKLNESSEVLGLFSRALILKQTINTEITIIEMAHDLRNDVYEAVQNEEVPYHHVIKDTGIHPKLAMNWHPKMPDFVFDDLIISGIRFGQLRSDMDMNLHCTDVGETVELILRYNKSLFSKSRISTFLEQFVNILKQVSEDADICVSSVKLKSDQDVNIPSRPVSQGSRDNELVISKFLKIAQKYPESNAITFRRQNWNYKDLDEISSKVAMTLTENGYNCKSPIAIFGEKSPAMVISILASVKAGGAFLILDSYYPNEQLIKFCNVSKPSFIIDCSSLEENFKLKGLAQTAYLKLPCDISTSNEILKSTDTEYSITPANPADIAYYLNTSGSTGRPKCITTDHRPLVNFINWHVERFALTKDDSFTMLSGLSHDPILRDIFTPLSIGASIEIPDINIQFDATRLVEWLKETRPTICHLTPQMATVVGVGTKNNDFVDSIKFFFCGGDNLKKEHLNYLKNVTSDAKVINFYGASETPQAIAYYEVNSLEGDQIIPIGKGAANAHLTIVTKEGHTGGIGEIGEIKVESQYLSLGYLGDEANQSYESNNLYTTGDFGYYNSNGDIVLIGRIDDQFKVRGYRIELADINSHIQKCHGVKKSICTVEKKDRDEVEITAYIVKSIDHPIDNTSLNQALLCSIPNYMIPKYYIFLDELPMLPSGKINRHALPKPSNENAVRVGGQHRPPINNEQKKIVAELEELLGRQNISISDNFADLGGDSLSLVHFSLFLENQLGHAPSNWNVMSIEELAKVAIKRSRIHDISTAIFIRALSIFLIVVVHFWGDLREFFGGGATDALLLVSGLSFADFQVKSMAYSKNVKPVIKFLLRIITPTMLYIIFVAMYRGEFHKEILFLYSNLYDIELRGIAYWFIEVLVQLLLIYTVLFSLKPAREYAISKPYQFAIIIHCIALSAALFGELLWNTEHLWNRVPHMKWYYFSMGYCIYNSITAKQKMLTLVLAIFSPLLVEQNLGLMLISTAVLLLFCPSIKIFTPLNKVVYYLAGASLFIYLSHFQFRGVLHSVFNITDYPALDIGVGLIGGVFMWLLWEKGTTFLVRATNLLMQKNTYQ